MEKLKKTAVFAFLILFISADLFAVSILYDNPARASDSYNLLSHFSAAGTDELSGWKVKIRIEDRGDAIWEWFGHTSILVEDPEGNQFSYDYGLFDFGQDNFVLNFIMGQSYYSVGVSNGSGIIWSAENQQRTLYEYELNLDDAAASRVAKFLDWNIQPGNNYYLYRIFADNCSTRLRDIIDKATEGQFRIWADSIEGTSLRQEAARATAPSIPYNWALNLLTSGTIDKPITFWDEMFLPERLGEGIEKFSYIDAEGNVRPLMKSKTIPVYFRDKEVRKRTFEVYSPELTLPTTAGAVLAVLTIFLLAMMRVSDSRFWRIALGIPSFLLCLSFGALSLVMIFIGLFTIHDFGWWNENLVYINPMLFIIMIRFLALSFGKKENEERRLRNLRRDYSILLVLMIILLVLKLIIPSVFRQYIWGSFIPFALCYSAFVIGSLIPWKKKADSADPQPDSESDNT